MSPWPDSDQTSNAWHRTRLHTDRIRVPQGTFREQACHRTRIPEPGTRRVSARVRIDLTYCPRSAIALAGLSQTAGEPRRVGRTRARQQFGVGVGFDEHIFERSPSVSENDFGIERSTRLPAHGGRAPAKTASTPLANARSQAAMWDRTSWTVQAPTSVSLHRAQGQALNRGGQPRHICCGSARLSPHEDPSTFRLGSTSGRRLQRGAHGALDIGIRRAPATHRYTHGPDTTSRDATEPRFVAL